MRQLTQKQQLEYEKYIKIFGYEFKKLCAIAVYASIDAATARKELGILIEKNKSRRK